MGINLNVLSAVAGAAEQYTKNTGELKKELRENKRRQRDWLATYGSKALNENKQKQESVQSALNDLKSRGLDTPDAIQLLQKHGVGSVLELAKYVKEYELKNNTSVDADLMNKLWTSADDFTTTETTFEAAVAKVFGSSAGAATAPVIQEAEDRNFFDQLKYNMGDRYDDELEDFLTDSSEGIGGKSIRELRAMSASSPSMLGTDGSAVFDRSALRGNEPSAGEARLWGDTVPQIVREALKNLSEEDRKAVEMIDDNEGNFTRRNADDIFFDLSDPDPNSPYKDAFDEATRKVHEQNPFSDNRSATGAYGGQAALDAILNPPPPLTPKELVDQLNQDLIDNNLTGARPEDIGEKTDVEIGEWFRDNEKDFVIANGELRNRDPAAPFDAAKVVVPIEAEVTEAQEAQTERLKTAENILPSERPELSGRSGTAEYGESLRKRAAFDAANEGKYELDGTPILAPMYPNSETEAKLLVEPPWNFNVKGADKKEDAKGPSAGDSIRRPSDLIAELEDKTLENFQEEWNARYKETHDPLTGFPLGAKFTESAEADE